MKITQLSFFTLLFAIFLPYSIESRPKINSYKEINSSHFIRNFDLFLSINVKNMDSFLAEFELFFDLFLQFQSLNQDDKNKAFISFISDFEFCNSLLQLIINDDCLKKHTDKKNRFLQKADEYLFKNPPNLLFSLEEICKIYQVDFEKSHWLLSTNQYSLFFAYLFGFEHLMGDYPSNPTN